MPALLAEDDLRVIVSERLNFTPSGKRFRCHFIEPGVVDYSDVGCGIELLRRETIDAALNSAISNPLTKGHISTRINSFDGISHGAIDKVGYDDAERMYFCEGEITTDEARGLIKRGQKPSCGYTVTSFGPGGRYNNVPYEREITGIKFHHLAIVENPRYQEADFRLNSKTGKPVMFKFIKTLLRPKEGGGEETVREEGNLPADTTLEINGKPVRLNDVIKAKVDADAKEARENAISEDAEIEYAPGKTAKLSVLIAAHRANEAASDCDESDEDKKKKKDDDDAKARENEVAKKAKDAESRANSTAYRVLQNAQKSAPPVIERANSANTLQEQIQRGQERYGSSAKN
jgi:hypothetical protein